MITEPESILLSILFEVKDYGTITRETLERITLFLSENKTAEKVKKALEVK